MDETKVALEFWQNIKHYPSYPNTLQRRLIDVNFVVKRVASSKSVLDIGCGDGALLLALREFTEIDTFHGYDISSLLLGKLLDRWGKAPGLNTKLINLITLDELPITDVTLSMGLFIYIFKNEQIYKLLQNIKSDLLIVRVPCTLKDNAEIINKFSEDLGENYAAIYRTVAEYESILSKQFIISEIKRAYPDEIESKYGSKQFFFVCERK